MYITTLKHNLNHRYTSSMRKHGYHFLQSAFRRLGPLRSAGLPPQFLQCKLIFTSLVVVEVFFQNINPLDFGPTSSFNASRPPNLIPKPSALNRREKGPSVSTLPCSRSSSDSMDIICEAGGNIIIYHVRLVGKIESTRDEI